jgi:hypothetical protein
MPRSGSVDPFIRRLWRCTFELFFRRSINFGTVELLVCSHDDWKKSAGSEHYRVSGLLRKYQPPVQNLLEQEERVLFLSDPGTASSILANQLESRLAESGYFVRSLSLKKSKRRLTALPQPLISTETSQAWCLLTDLDHVVSAELTSFRKSLDEIQSAGWRVALFGTQGYVTNALAGIEDGASRYHILGLAPLDIQRICDQEGIDAHSFGQELDRLDLHTEAANPAILQRLVRRFRCRGRLPQKRSEALGLIWRTMRKCTRVRGRNVIAAAKALGLAMELASRNTLTSQEAELAISSRLDRTSPGVDSLLASMAQLLLFTPDGICFPHHSLGEFLAASEIRASPLSLILDYLFLPGSRNPNTSWIPAVGFLAEMRADLGSYLAPHRPEFALQAGFSSLTTSEKGTIGEKLSKRLRTRAEPLRRHPEISAYRLGQCLSAERLKELHTEAQIGTDSILVANALYLLGESGHRDSLALARAKALDNAADLAIRHAAFHAVGRLGTVSLIPDLIDGVHKSDPAFVSMLAAVGSLADATVIEQVVGATLSTQTYITSFYERLRELEPKPTALSLLSMIRSRPGLVDNPQWTFYASCLDGALRRAWDAELAEAAVGALIAIEEARVLDLQNNFIEDLADAIAYRDRDETVVRQALEQLAKRGRPVIAITRTLLRLASPATIRRLAVTDCDEAFIASLRMYARGKLYSVFEEISPSKPSEPDPQLLAWEDEHRQRFAEAEGEVSQAQAIVRDDPDFPRVYRAALFLEEKRLPEISPERNEWLATEVDRQFLSVDFSLIEWAGDNSCSIPWLLAGLLILIHRYRLRLANDVPLIRSLNGLRGEAAELHVRQYGLTQAGRLELEKMIADTALNASALDTVLHFVRATQLWTNGIAAALCDRALSPDLRVQGAALFTLFEFRQSTGILADLASQKVTRMPDSLFNELVKRQHRPTIERRLPQLIGTPSLLAAGEVDYPNTSPLDWIGEIREPEVWNKLQKIRGLALDNGYFRVVGTATAAMAAIDEERLIGNMAIQLRRAPKAWRPWQQTGILESRQRVRLALARTTSFKKVVSKLQMKSTQKRLKIWCEGVTDLPALRGFIERTIGERDDVVIQPIGGWSELGNPDFPLERLWDGCLDILLIADGDNGRDWSRPERPLSPVGAALIKRLEALGVTGFVLQRYGLENYFSKAAVQAVLGPAVAQHFPLADDAKGADVPGYSKGRNGEIAAAMTLDDLRGSDLHFILQEIKQRVEW